MTEKTKKALVLGCCCILAGMGIGAGVFWGLAVTTGALNIGNKAYAAFFYIGALQSMDVKISFPGDFEQLDPSLNPLTVPSGYSITQISRFGTMETFINAVETNNITNVCFAWENGNWTFAYLQLYPEYCGADIMSYSNGGY
jgi:hypothetical protein